ncbi:uncharacterized protein LOC119083453, partial [Bradysia coprophila]|uniref:uncharacterized protein LOC119083453 n=1 Tax=Bradysia coprophila TaxID=38358 RepID=UPI00187D7B7D
MELSGGNETNTRPESNFKINIWNSGEKSIFMAADLKQMSDLEAEVVLHDPELNFGDLTIYYYARNGDKIQIANASDFDRFLVTRFNQNIYLSCGNGDAREHVTENFPLKRTTSEISIISLDSCNSIESSTSLDSWIIVDSCTSMECSKGLDSSTGLDVDNSTHLDSSTRLNSPSNSDSYTRADYPENVDVVLVSSKLFDSSTGLDLDNSIHLDCSTRLSVDSSRSLNSPTNADSSTRWDYPECQHFSANADSYTRADYPETLHVVLVSSKLLDSSTGLDLDLDCSTRLSVDSSRCLNSPTNADSSTRWDYPESQDVVLVSSTGLDFDNSTHLDSSTRLNSPANADSYTRADYPESLDLVLVSSKGLDSLTGLDLDNSIHLESSTRLIVDSATSLNSPTNADSYKPSEYAESLDV